jgi:hypothetical protein
MNLRITQKQLLFAAAGLLFLVVEYWIWSAMLEPINRDLETLPRDIERVKKLARESETKRDREKVVYLEKKTDWTARHEKDLAAARVDAAKDWKELTIQARAETAALRLKSKSARAALAVDKTEVQLQSEIRRQINALTAKYEIGDADRQVNVTARTNGQTGWLELSVQFQFRLRHDPAVSLITRELEEALPFLALDSVKLTPMQDQKATFALDDKLTLAGTLTGYVYPAGTPSK